VPDPTECELFLRARSGDRAAFDDLRALVEPRVRRFVCRLVGTGRNDRQGPAAEDIVQDAFLSLFLNLARIDPVENLLPFLFKIVRNRCYDELRRKGRFQVVSLDAGAGEGEASPLELLDGRPQPDEQIFWALALAEVRKAIDRLPELQRQTLILFCEEDLSYPQIAAAMGTDVGTVKSRIHYARRHLRRLLRPDILRSLGVEEEGHAHRTCGRAVRPSG
jgi:RNA polymerase sigma-70 factor (ECF subfamily)